MLARYLSAKAFGPESRTGGREMERGEEGGKDEGERAERARWQASTQIRNLKQHLTAALEKSVTSNSVFILIGIRTINFQRPGNKSQSPNTTQPTQKNREKWDKLLRTISQI